MMDAFFRRLLENPSAHARFVNTLSFIEYVGARKILKSQRAEFFSLELLTHVSEEIRHARRLKRLALEMSDGRLDSYGAGHLLAGKAAEAYVQAVDAAAQAASGGNDPWVAYLLTTLLVEERANAFYPAYASQGTVPKHRAVIAAIVSEEQRHLEEIGRRLRGAVVDSHRVLTELRRVEEDAFHAFIASAFVDIDS